MERGADHVLPVSRGEIPRRPGCVEAPRGCSAPTIAPSCPQRPRHRILRFAVGNADGKPLRVAPLCANQMSLTGGA